MRTLFTSFFWLSVYAMPLSAEKQSVRSNFTILTTPIIITQPKSDSACVGESVAFSVTTDNQSEYGYQWRKDTIPIQGATLASYTIANTQLKDAGTYDVIVTGSSSVTSSSADFTLNSPPSITYQQNDTSVCYGSQVILYCSFAGTNLTYQWKKDGANITGATNPTLEIASVMTGDIGRYSIAATGKCSPLLTSKPINVRIVSPPAFVSQSRDTAICEGQPIQLFAVASGNSVIYQWRKNGMNINNATQSTYTIMNTASTDTGTYDVIAQSPCYNSTFFNSAPIRLKVLETVTITNQLNDTNIRAGLPVSFTTTATGASLKYQWLKNEINLPKDTLPTITFTKVKLLDSGAYKCIVRSNCGSVISSIAKLNVTPGPSLALVMDTIFFGPTAIFGSRDYVALNIVKNVGQGTLRVDKIEYYSPDSYENIPGTNNAPFTLEPNETKSLSIRFAPLGGGRMSGFINFTSNTTTPSPLLYLEGEAGNRDMYLFSNYTHKCTVGLRTLDSNYYLSNGVMSSVNVLDISLKSGSQFKLIKTDKPLPAFLDRLGAVRCTFEITPKSTGLLVDTILVRTNNMEPLLKFQIKAEGVNPVSVNELAASAGGVVVYPNPSSGNVSFIGSIQSTMLVKARIFDVVGNSIYSSMVRVADADGFAFTWDSSDNGNYVSNGTYIAVFSIGTQTLSVPFVIAR